MATGLTIHPPPALEGVAGFRDLGGFPTRTGPVTRTGVLYRSACPSELTTADRAVLGRLRLGARVDLRASFEITDAPPVELPSIPVVRVPLVESPDAASYVRRLRGVLGSRRDPAAVLIATLRLGADGLTRAFMIAVERAPVLVHCTTGRDRTGLLAALALRLADVDDALIALDYAESAPAGKGEPLLEALDLLDRDWGGAENYLVAHGLPAATAAAFRRAFVTS